MSQLFELRLLGYPDVDPRPTWPEFIERGSRGDLVHGQAIVSEKIYVSAHRP